MCPEMEKRLRRTLWIWYCILWITSLSPRTGVWPVNRLSMLYCATYSDFLCVISTYLHSKHWSACFERTKEWNLYAKLRIKQIDISISYCSNTPKDFKQLILYPFIELELNSQQAKTFSISLTIIGDPPKGALTLGKIRLKMWYFYHPWVLQSPLENCK